MTRTDLPALIERELGLVLGFPFTSVMLIVPFKSDRTKSELADLLCQVNGFVPPGEYCAIDAVGRFATSIGQFTACLYTVEDRICGGVRFALVAIAGKNNRHIEVEIPFVWAELARRATEPLFADEAKSFFVAGTTDGWQLSRSPQFPQLLGSLRTGRGYLVTAEEGALRVPY